MNIHDISYNPAMILEIILKILILIT